MHILYEKDINSNNVSHCTQINEKYVPVIEYILGLRSVGLLKSTTTPIINVFQIQKITGCRKKNWVDTFALLLRNENIYRASSNQQV